MESNENYEYYRVYDNQETVFDEYDQDNQNYYQEQYQPEANVEGTQPNYLSSMGYDPYQGSKPMRLVCSISDRTYPTGSGYANANELRPGEPLRADD